MDGAYTVKRGAGWNGIRLYKDGEKGKRVVSKEEMKARSRVDEDYQAVGGTERNRVPSIPRAVEVLTPWLYI